MTEIQNLESKLESVKTIQEMVHHTQSTRDFNVTIVWIPGHAGIPGNELADSATKNSKIAPLRNIDIPVQDFQQIIKDKATIQQQQTWKSVTNNKLRNIKEDTTIWNLDRNRKEQTMLTRLRIGHMKISHEHLLTRNDPKITPITVEHLLIDCPKYRNKRNKFKIPNTVKEALQNNSTTTTNLINFLRAHEEQHTNDI